jgi:DNA-binding beta-propeller fold protein YncE
MGYIVEQAGSRIRSIVLSTAVVSTLAGSGIAGFEDNSNGLLARFNYPTSAVWHPSGLLYVADGVMSNRRIRRVIISTTAVSTLAGNGAAGGLDGVGTSATFNIPRGITLDATFSKLYIAESIGNRIRSISLSTALVQTIAGSVIASYANGFGVSAGFNGPLFLAISPSGVIYTADLSGNRIRQLTCVPCPPGLDCSSGAPAGGCAAVAGRAHAGPGLVALAAHARQLVYTRFPPTWCRAAEGI